jgi:hypothetical protein
MTVTPAFPNAIELAVYSCAMTGETGLACCCDKDPGEIGPAISGTDGCCDVNILECGQKYPGHRLDLPDSERRGSATNVKPRSMASALTR